VEQLSRFLVSLQPVFELQLVDALLLLLPIMWLLLLLMLLQLTWW
jgi:hypothetical protein